MIRIKSKKPGFRRCGIAHAAGPVEYPDGRFTAAELAMLKAEPMLDVEVVQAEELPPPAPPPPPPPAQEETEDAGEESEKPAESGKKPIKPGKKGKR